MMKVINQDAFQVDWWRHLLGGLQRDGKSMLNLRGCPRPFLAFGPEKHDN